MSRPRKSSINGALQFATTSQSYCGMFSPIKTGKLRALLVLGRVSNLPTVWSNCLAGWLLGGGGAISNLLIACLGTTCIYVGGMYLNDAFDEQFDREYRKERPIPSGLVSSGEVWMWGSAWLLAGTILLSFFGVTTMTLVFLLATCVVVYDAVHKAIAFSPVLMAMCRFFVYLIAASLAVDGVTGFTIWSALALGLYIVGLSYIARKESIRGMLGYWPAYLLATPIVLAFIGNEGQYAQRALLLSMILGCWILRCLQFTYWSTQRQVGRTVSGLLAGIVWVDLLAVAGGPGIAVSTVFLGLFILALVFQRFVPAT